MHHISSLLFKISFVMELVSLFKDYHYIQHLCFKYSFFVLTIVDDKICNKSVWVNAITQKQIHLFQINSEKVFFVTQFPLCLNGLQILKYELHFMFLLGRRNSKAYVITGIPYPYTFKNTSVLKSLSIQTVWLKRNISKI